MRYLPFLLSVVLFMTLLMSVIVKYFPTEEIQALHDLFSYRGIQFICLLELAAAVCLFIYSMAKPASYLIIIISILIAWGAYKSGFTLAIVLSIVNILIAIFLMWTKTQVKSIIV